MKRGTPNILLSLAAVFCVVFVGVCMFRRTPLGHVLWPPKHPPTASDVPVFATPPARGLNLLFPELFARSVTEDDDVLLITRIAMPGELPEVPKQWPIYRYDARTRTLIWVDPSKWGEDGGQIGKPGRGSASGRFICKEVDGILKYRARPGEALRDFQTVGEFALRPTFSPDGKDICVLTADGPERPSSGPDMVFGSVGGGYYGQHYLEFFRLPDMAPIGKVVRIPFTTVEGIGMPCWSPDGRFLVYSNYEGTKMCVIHVDQEDQER